MNEPEKPPSVEPDQKPPSEKSSMAMYFKITVFAIVILVTLSELIISQRTSMSINMGVLERVLDLLNNTMAPEQQ